MLFCMNKELVSIAEATGDEEKTYDHMHSALCYFSLSVTGIVEIIDMAVPISYEKNKRKEVLL